MSLYKELQPFYEFIHSIRKFKSHLSLDMKFPTKWSLPKTIVEEGQIVGFESDDANFKGVSFVSEFSEIGLSNTINKIAKIIKLNKEKEQKEILFKQTIENLKKTFEQTDLDSLKKLYFDFQQEDKELTLDYEQNESTSEIDEDDGKSSEER